MHSILVSRPFMASLPLGPRWKKKHFSTTRHPYWESQLYVRSSMLLHTKWREIWTTQASEQFVFIGASTSEPHSQELNSKSVTRDIYIYRYIYISIVGWSPSFEPAPGAAPAGLVACRNREALPRKGPLSLYTYLQQSTWHPVGSSFRRWHTLNAGFSSAKYNTSGRIGFLSLHAQHACPNQLAGYHYWQ